MLGNSLWISALSLGWQKALEEGLKGWLYLLLSGLLARSGIQIPPALSTATEGDRRPARRQAVNASRKRCLEKREERRAVADLTEREGLKFERRRERCAARGRRRKNAEEEEGRGRRREAGRAANWEKKRKKEKKERVDGLDWAL